MRARRSEPAPRRLLAVVVRRLLRSRSLPDDLLAVHEHVVLVRILERDVVSLAAVEDVDLAVAGERVQPVVARRSARKPASPSWWSTSLSGRWPPLSRARVNARLARGKDFRRLLLEVDVDRDDRVGLDVATVDARPAAGGVDRHHQLAGAPLCCLPAVELTGRDTLA